ncbi:MAG: anti-sigma factor antagonist [Calditrichaeota bacterium]|nr:MAG: anti-sigma factor antagonist [Calditrichota bacterium]
MGEETQVATRVRDDVAIIDIKGEVTSFAEQVLEDAYAQLTDAGFTCIGFNFSDVSYINSAGMAILIGILTKSRKRNQTLLAWGLTEHFQKIFGMVGITKYMPHLENEDAALSYVKQQ